MRIEVRGRALLMSATPCKDALAVPGLIISCQCSVEHRNACDSHLLFLRFRIIGMAEVSRNRLAFQVSPLAIHPVYRAWVPAPLACFSL